MQLQSDIKINEYSVISGKITEKELKQKKLLLCLYISKDELEAALIDSNDHSVYLSCSYISSQRFFAETELLFLINDFITRFHFQQYLFKDVQIILSAPHFTLCPEEFYLPEKKHMLLNFAHPVQPNEIILADVFENIRIIYGIHQNIHQNLLQIFPSAHLFHSAAAMMHLFFYHPLLIHAKLWIHIHPNYIEVIAKNERQLLFYNTFDVQTSLDILYYILFCIQQLHFSAKETDVFLSGNISLNNSVFQLLQKYVHSIQLVHHHPKLHILPLDASLISHHHFITLNHHLCVSYQENTKAEK